MTANVGDHDRLILAELLAQSNCAVAVMDSDGTCTMVNERWSEIAGMGADAAIGDGWMDAVHPEDRADLVGAWWSAVHACSELDEQFRFRHPDGSVRHARAIARPVSDASGTVAWAGTVCEQPDPSPPRPRDSHAEAGFLAAALANSSDLVVVIDETATLTYVSAASLRILGWDPDDWVGHNVLELLHPDDANAAVESLVTSVDSGGGVKDPLEVRVRHADGRWREVEIVANNLLEDPAVRGIVINARDVSERHQSQRSERRAQRRFEQAFERSPIGMALTTLDGRYLRVNDALCTLLERSTSELLTTSALDTTHPDDLRATVDAAIDLLEGTAPSFSLEKRFRTGTGDAVWTRATTTVLRDEDGEPLHFLTQVENIEERRRLVEQLRRSALLDPLTGLANRAGLGDYLETVPARARIGVIALDLDRFKHVNDSRGHAVGDEVLRIVSQRIRSSVRPNDHAARTGGDEFVIICADPRNDDDLAAMANRLIRQIQELIRVDDRELSIGASAGIAIGRADRAADLLVSADNASYAAKRKGGNQLELGRSRALSERAGIAQGRPAPADLSG